MRNRVFVASLTRTLDLGEAESIALAIQKRVDFLLLDERDGREVARRLDLPITGTLGLLMRAKLNGDLPSLKEAIVTLQEDFAFSLSPQLVARVLAEVGETKAF